MSITLDRENDFFNDAFRIPNNFDPRKIPVRDWIIDGLLLRNYLSIIIGAGGVGKSTYALSVGVALAAGAPLLGLSINKKQNILVINNEDDENELKRRVASICIHYGIDPESISGNIELYSGYKNEFKMATCSSNNRAKISEHAISLIDKIRRDEIDVVVIDPFVSTHNCNENDNTIMNKVASIYKRVCSEANVSILMIHHVRKEAGNQRGSNIKIEDARGAKSVTDAARIVHGMSKIPSIEAKKLGAPPEDCNNLIRLIPDLKTNYVAQNNNEYSILRLVSVSLENSKEKPDVLGVPELYKKTQNLYAPNKFTTTMLVSALERIASKVFLDPPWKLRDILGDLKEVTNRGQTTISDTIALLPYSRSNAIEIKTSDRDTTALYYATKKDPDKSRSPWLIHRESIKTRQTNQLTS